LEGVADEVRVDNMIHTHIHTCEEDEEKENKAEEE
jgi:hypothetical protein